MQKNQKRKHGFTLVELSIVIAVIAILIAVLVPTFTALIDKANKTNDNSLVKNLNTGLSTDEAINGKPSTIDEALVAAEGAGYKVENLTPTSDGTLIVWNEVDNEFVYVEADLVNGNLVEVDGEALTTDSCNIWIITKSYDSTYADFSQYISGTLAENTTLKVKAGISVGNNTNINVTYKPDSTAAKTVTFVTNGGTLELDDEGATVSHYGSATTVTITAVDKLASYHLYGTVTGNIEVKSGHVVIESTATASTIIVTAASANDAKENVSIANNSSATVEVASTTIDNISSAVTITGSNNTVDTKVDEETLSNFAGGLGTENSPYLISTAEQFVNIGDLETNMYNKTAYYFSILNDINLNDIDLSESTYISKYFCGGLNGNGYKLIANDDLSYIFCDAINDTVSKVTTFENINLLLGNRVVNLCPGYYYTKANITFDNVDVGMVDETSSVTLVKNQGIYLGWAGYSYGKKSNFYIGRGTYNFVNCDCSVNVSNATDYNAIFVGGGIYYANVNIDNCSYSGEYVGQQCGLALGNATTSYFSNCKITVSNFTNLGKVYGTSWKPVLAGASSSSGLTDSKYIAVDDATIDLGTLKYLYDKGLALTTDSNGQFIITEGSGASSYTLTIAGGARGFFYAKSGTFANQENSTYSFTIDLGEISFNTSGKYETGFYKGKFATKAQYLSDVDKTETFASVTWYDIVSNDGGKVCMIKYTDSEGAVTYYYVFDFSTSSKASTYTMQFVKQGTSTLAIVETKTSSSNVSTYDAKGELQGTAYGS